MKKVIFAVVLAVFLLSSVASSKTEEKTTEGKKYRTHIRLSKALNRDDIEKLMAAYRERIKNKLVDFTGGIAITTHNLSLQESAKGIHGFIMTVKDVLGKDAIREITVSMPPTMEYRYQTFSVRYPKGKRDTESFKVKVPKKMQVSEEPISYQEFDTLCAKLPAALHPKVKGGLISIPYLEDKDIRSILELLESQTKYSFEYQDDVEGLVDLVALEVPPLEIAFDIILKENGYDYKIKDNTIHVYRTEKKPEKEPLSEEGQYQRYITTYRKMIKKYPEEKNWDAYAQNEIGKLFIKMENYSQASKEFQKVVDNYPWSDYTQEAQESINEIRLKHQKK